MEEVLNGILPQPFNAIWVRVEVKLFVNLNPLSYVHMKVEGFPYEFELYSFSLPVNDQA